MNREQKHFELGMVAFQKILLAKYFLYQPSNYCSSGLWYAAFISSSRLQLIFKYSFKIKQYRNSASVLYSGGN